MDQTLKQKSKLKNISFEGGLNIYFNPGGGFREGHTTIKTQVILYFKLM
jgi:hypothetical protein